MANEFRHADSAEIIAVDAIAAIDLTAPRRRALARQPWMAIALRYLIITIAVLPFVIPFYWLLISAFKTRADLLTLPPSWWPDPWTIHNMQTAMGLHDFLTYIRNTAYITIFNVIATTVSSAIIAYPFARLKFRGRDFLFF